MRLQPWASWYYSVSSWTDELASKHPLDLAGREFYNEMYLDGFRPHQAAKEAVYQAEKEE